MKTQDVITGMRVEDSKKLINIVTDIETRLVNIKRDYFEIGRLLSKAKEILPHGKFQQWIEIHFKSELPYSTAALFMKIYNTFENAPATVQYLPITFLMKMTEQSFPEEIIKIITEQENTDMLDIQVITETYQLYKAKEIDLSEFERIAKKQFDLAVQIQVGRTQRRLSGEYTETIHLGMGVLFNAIKKIRTVSRRMRYFINPSDDKPIIKDIDKAISELQELKHNLLYGDGLFVIDITNEKTGTSGLIPNKNVLLEPQISNN